MNEIDYKIRQALAEEDAEIFDEYDELNVLEQVVDSFRKKSVLLILLSILVGIAFMSLGVFCAVRFFQVESVRDMMIWAMGLIFCFSAVSMMKIWYWMELQKNSVTREIKRVELQLAGIAKRLK